MHNVPRGTNEVDLASVASGASYDDGLNSDEMGEYCDKIDPGSQAEEKVHNWRQLFDQEELNMAYHQSMVGFGFKDEGGRPDSQPERVSEREEYEDEGGQDNNSDAGATPAKRASDAGQAEGKSIRTKVEMFVAGVGVSDTRNGGFNAKNSSVKTGG